MYILVTIKRHVSANSWPSSGLTVSFKVPHTGILRDTVNPDDGHELAETCRLILTRIYIFIPTSCVNSGTLRDTVKPDDGHELAETCRLILTRIYILHTN